MHYTKRITYGLGIGYPQKRWALVESDDTELMIGALMVVKLQQQAQNILEVVRK